MHADKQVPPILPTWGQKHTHFLEPFCSEYQTMNEVQEPIKIHPSKVNMVDTVFWVVTLHSLEKDWQFGGCIYRLHLQGWTVSRARNQQKLAASWPTLQHRSWRWHVSSKCWALSKLHGNKTQKAVLFIVTAVGTSNSNMGLTASRDGRGYVCPLYIWM
jgi:hypothetical protein